MVDLDVPECILHNRVAALLGIVIPQGLVDLRLGILDPGQLEEVEGPGGGAGLGHLAPGEAVGPGPVDVHPVNPLEEAPLLRHQAQVTDGA